MSTSEKGVCGYVRNGGRTFSQGRREGRGGRGRIQRQGDDRVRSRG